ncbi:MAG TPA: nitrate reductase associated protein [Candidatus Binatia bacterium]|jgi:hypothetical protein
MFYRFQHEADFYPELTRVPLHVRMRLDLTGIKLSLNQWLAFALEERRIICHLPVESEAELEAFVAYVNFLCRRYNGSTAQMLPPVNSALWNSLGQIPEAVLQNSRDCGLPVTLEEWTRWQFHERYALYKTAVSKSEPEKFFAVLTELRQRKNVGNSSI